MCIYEAILLVIEKKTYWAGMVGNKSKRKGVRKCWPSTDTLGWQTARYTGSQVHLCSSTQLSASQGYQYLASNFSHLFSCFWSTTYLSHAAGVMVMVKL